LTTGLMGWPGLCKPMRPFMVGDIRFMFVYFHLDSCGIRILLLIIVFLIWDWKVLVGSMCVVLKLLFCVKSCSLWLYCWEGKIILTSCIILLRLVCTTWWWPKKWAETCSCLKHIVHNYSAIKFSCVLTNSYSILYCFENTTGMSHLKVKIFIFGLSKHYSYPWIATFVTIFHTLQKWRG
jgi:hypothetical protein